MGRLEGKIAVVTGAAVGIGAATARAFAREGARVVATDTDAERGRITVRGILGNGGDARFVPQDVSLESDWQKLREMLLAEYGRLDVLVNNAGVFMAKPIVETTLEEFRRINRVNVDGCFLGTKYAVKIMTETAPAGSKPRGSIVNLSSILGQVALPNAAAYCASKGAVRILSKSVAVECGTRRDEIRVNSVHPGMVRTPMNEALLGTEVWHPGNPAFANVPLQTFAEPDEVAAAIVYLASDEARLVTGAELTIDGGWTAL